MTGQGQGDPDSHTLGTPLRIYFPDQDGAAHSPTSSAPPIASLTSRHLSDPAHPKRGHPGLQPP